MLILNLTDRHLRPRTDTRFQTGLSHYAWLSRKFLHSIYSSSSFFFSLLFTLPVFYLSVLSAGNWAVDLDASVPEGEIRLRNDTSSPSLWKRKSGATSTLPRVRVVRACYWWHDALELRLQSKAANVHLKKERERGGQQQGGCRVLSHLKVSRTLRKFGAFEPNKCKWLILKKKSYLDPSDKDHNGLQTFYLFIVCMHKKNVNVFSNFMAAKLTIFLPECNQLCWCHKVQWYLIATSVMWLSVRLTAALSLSSSKHSEGQASVSLIYTYTYIYIKIIFKIVTRLDL